MLHGSLAQLLKSSAKTLTELSLTAVGGLVVVSCRFLVTTNPLTLVRGQDDILLCIEVHGIKFTKLTLRACSYATMKHQRNFDQIFSKACVNLEELKLDLANVPCTHPALLLRTATKLEVLEIRGLVRALKA